jgi:hypothetical protein
VIMSRTPDPRPRNLAVWTDASGEMVGILPKVL